MRKRVRQILHVIQSLLGESELFPIVINEHRSLQNDVLLIPEYRILCQITPNRTEERNFFVVDIAASDGVSASPVLPYYMNGAHGLAIEFDVVKFAHLSYVYRRFPLVTLVRSKVIPNNVAKILGAYNTPMDFDVLNLDIDSFDLEVLLEMLFSGYRPKVISIEINEKIPPSIYFNVKYDENHRWQGNHFYGCSLAAANLEICQFDYRLVWLEYNNAFFVHKDYSGCTWPTLSTEDAYIRGYLDRPEMTHIFSYNKDVFAWNEIPSKLVVEQMNELFSNYSGMYELYEIYDVV
jgi:hypothetical protein